MELDADKVIKTSNLPFKRGHPSNEATFSLQKGCPYKRGTTVFISLEE
jgi:hypothetical protein